MIRGVLSSVRRPHGAVKVPRGASASAVLTATTPLEQQQPSWRLQSARGFQATIERFPKPLRTKQHGIDILHDPLWSKSTAFDYPERDRMGLRGLLPPVVRTLEGQVERVMSHLRNHPDNISKAVYLEDIHNRNETLYHRLLVDHIEEVAPLVYTPTVGEVCQQFGHQFRRPRGMYFSRQDKGMFSSMVYNWPHDDVHVIVVTDGSRILGLGDLGVHGMGIPIGKLALYSAAGGIAPHRVLPVMIDVGTNNPKLLSDPDYLGIRKERLVGEEYFSILDEFMGAVFDRWPNVIVQFEDFESAKANALLSRYRNKFRMFNDDIQGTGAVTLACLMSAAKTAGTKLTDMTFVCAGTGSAGLGVCTQIFDGLVQAGLNPAEARSRFVLANVNGAVGAADGKFGNPNHAKGLPSELIPWVNTEVSDGLPLKDIISSFKPNVLLGLSTQPNLFTEEMVRTMNENCLKSGVRPIIMPMSNPTSRAECNPDDAYKWTNGNAIVATGSPFPITTLPDGRQCIPSQCNNMYIFPGIGLAASVAGITRITDEMLYRAAVTCSECMSDEERRQGRVFPSIRRIRDVSRAVAVEIIHVALEHNMAPKINRQMTEEGINHLVQRKMYFPNYVPLVNKH